MKDIQALKSYQQVAAQQAVYTAPILAKSDPAPHHQLPMLAFNLAAVCQGIQKLIGEEVGGPQVPQGRPLLRELHSTRGEPEFRDMSGLTGCGEQTLTVVQHAPGDETQPRVRSPS